MKEKITGMISFLASIAWGLFGLFGVMNQSRLSESEFVAFMALFISIISVILYVIWTNFGEKKYSELDKMEYENQLLRLQVERIKLEKKLAN